MNKAFFNDKSSKEQSPKKAQQNTARATNIMSNFGLSERNTMSLKDEYFKNNSNSYEKEKSTDKFKDGKFFRVRNHSRVESVNDPEKEKVKEIH